ncbi:hypothetical protein [Nocardioides panaciterrulae]|uniref:Uncharacterized protein n=1 Tax=Nocardioides panaciterrulae TaxID=661492 RepID=A0A7Y9E392_9ACTN|nr:hypothetical protein [Nocardioides panaciterrulae]NYD40142.1 hypothetical protein [Nocardioides panaciterrulae]
MTAQLGPEQATRLHRAEDRWLALCAVRLRRSPSRRPVRGTRGRKAVR